MHKELREGKLVLADGSVFEGTLYGGKRNAVGEVCFTTGMCGYEETLTDPSLCGQIVVMTYPLIGNSGCNEMFKQSRRSYFQGLVVGELCDYPVNWRSEETLEAFLEREDVPCLADVDTRAITRKIRNNGEMKGVIVPAEMSNEDAMALLNGEAMHNQIETVTTKKVYAVGEGKYHVAVLDFGIKQSVIDYLLSFDCRLTVFPATATAEEVMACKPDGIFLSNGPADPKDCPAAVENIKKVIGKCPIFAICMGHQLLALANGLDTYKMKFGHRGANQPVKDLHTGSIIISSQCHGYAVCEKSMEGKPVRVTHVSMNDGTIEGLEYLAHPSFSVQYQPESGSEPIKHEYLFKHFIDLMEGR